MIKLLISLPILTTLGLFSDAALGNVYRWVDKDGNYHFSANPPANTKTEIINPTYIKPSSTSESNSQSTDQPASDNDEREEKESEYAKQLMKLEKERMAYCEKAKENKKSLLNNPRVMLMSNSGEARVLSHEEKLEQLKKADQQIDQFCGE